MSSELAPASESGKPSRVDWRGLSVLGGAALIVLVIYLAPNIFISVRSGEAGVLWRRFWGGTELARVYGEGTVVIFPWDKLHVYDLKVQHVRTQTQVYSSDGLALKVTVSGRFRIDPEHLPRLHAEVGPEYKRKLVEPELLASVRAVFGRYFAETVYTKSEVGLLPALGEDFVARLARLGLIRGDVQLERVELPEEVQDAIQRKLATAEAVQRERLEKDRRVIEAEGLAAFQSITGLPFLQWGALQVTSELAKSPNTKVIVIGNDRKSLPVILNAEIDEARAAAPADGKPKAEPKAEPEPPGESPPAAK